MISTYIILLVTILSVAVPLIYGLAKDKGKTQYKLTANICCFIISLALCFGIQYLLGASLSDKSKESSDMQDKNQSFVVDDGLYEDNINSDEQIDYVIDNVYGSSEISINNLICGLTGCAIFVVIIFSTYKLQYRFEVNKIIKEKSL